MVCPEGATWAEKATITFWHSSELQDRYRIKGIWPLQTKYHTSSNPLDGSSVVTKHSQLEKYYDSIPQG